MHCALTLFFQIQGCQIVINQGGHPIALVPMSPRYENSSLSPKRTKDQHWLFLQTLRPTWPGIVTGPRSPHLSAYLHMLHSHVARKLRGCWSRVQVHECTVRIGNVVSLLLWTSKIFSSCALQTFLLPLTHNLAKVPPSAALAFSRPSPSPSLLCSSIAQRRSPELHAKRRDSQACSDFAQSTDKAALWAFSREEICSRAESWSCSRTFDRQT